MIPTKTVSFKMWKVPKDWTTIKYDSWSFHQHYDRMRKSQMDEHDPQK